MIILNIDLLIPDERTISILLSLNIIIIIINWYPDIYRTVAYFSRSREIPIRWKKEKKKYGDREILLDNGTTRAKEGAIRSHVRPLNRSIRKSNKKTWNRLSMVGSCIDQWRARFRVPLSNWPATTKLPSRMVFFSRKNQGLCSNR